MSFQNFKLREELITRSFFRKMVLTVFAYITFYSGVYYFLGARFSALLLLFGCVCFTPLILKIEPKSPNIARFAFCFSGLFYIFATPLGIHKDMGIEMYYLAALMCPALLFNPNQRKWIIGTMLLSPLFYIYQRWGVLPQLNEFWIPNTFPDYIFKTLNFFGASGIMVLFLKYFVDRFHQNNIEMEQTTAELDEFFNVTLDPLCIANMSIGRFKKVNPAFAKILGYSVNELMAKSFSELVHPDDIDVTIVAHKRLTQGIPVTNFINRYRCADGNYKVLNWSTSPDIERGLVYAAARDITDLVNAEEATKNEKAKALHNAKLASLGEMSAGIAHEINNPLAIISGNAEMMRRHINEPNSFEPKIESILKATARIAKIVNGLRKFSRSTEKVEHRPFLISEIIKEAITLIEPKSKRYFTPVEVSYDTKAYIMCDEMEIEQVLINLIANGIDAVKSNEERWVKVKLFEENDQVVIHIRDSGKGINSEIAKKLFQPFFTTKPIGEGTGLGLSIVKGILDEHKASIDLINDQNTCFEIRFKKVSSAINVA
ncbi:MAG: ATP-binding protein [Bacteriovoracaceae bacterium]